MSETAEAVVTRLAPYSIGARASLEWPGTRLFGSPAQVYEYRFIQEVSDILGDLANGLYDWCAPTLPEDLFLTRDDGSEWLATIAHEKDSYLKLTVEEYQGLVLEIPEVEAILRHN